MKKELSTMPQSMTNMETYGFSWMEFVTAIPAPLFVVTSFKSNGKANACLQSWACFNGDEKGFYAVLSHVNKAGHMYQTIKESGICIINFPSADIYDRCTETIRNNQWETDEITSSGMTWEPGSIVNAPKINECFLALECHYMWEREIVEGNDHVLLCLKIVSICMDEAHLDEAVQGRYGTGGYLYNVHYPVNPENYNGKSRDSLAILNKLRNGDEY